MAPRTRPIVSRRERPAKPALTREGIVAAALEVMQAEGLARVTKRRIAQELDTGAASLYVYLRNTAELHAAMLEQLLGQVDLGPVTAAGDWRDRLITILTSYTGDISQTRAKLRYAHLTYFTDEERKGFALDVDNTSFWHDPVLTISFYGAMLAGFILAFDVLLPEISPI